MSRIRKPALLTTLGFCVVFTAAYAVTPHRSSSTTENSYHVYTGALQVSDSGVASIPARFKWSVETSWSGIDAQGKNLPDSRVMLRLYDPDHNFTAMTAQMDLVTAAKLHHELGDIIIKKLREPDYQHRPQLYSADKIPTGRIIGVNENGVAEVELKYSTNAGDESTPRPSPKTPNRNGVTRSGESGGT